MGKRKTDYICKECGYKTSGYLGKCPECNSWNSFEEFYIEKESSSLSSPKSMMGVKSKSITSSKLSSVLSSSILRIDTGNSEFNRVVGGGIVKDSVNIISAPPGMGKSTLLLQIANYIAEHEGPVLYVSGEESDTQVKLRADRILKTISDNLFIYTDTMLESIEQEIDSIKPVFIVIDSLQMLYSKNCDGTLYGDKQALTCVNALISNVKTRKIAVFLVGQMTKEDELRGSREVEHAVDAVFYMDKIDKSQVRILRATKNRFGNTDEVGMFEMNSDGLNEIADPARYFTSLHKTPQVGCALSITKEGTRSIITEAEVLSDPNVFSYPQRVSRGVPSDQLKVYLAILEKELSVRAAKKDVYLQICGGLKIRDEAIGLSVCAAIYSSIKKIAVPQDTIFIGSIGLTGHIKKVADIESIIKDCERFGFKRIIIPDVCLPVKGKYSIDIVGISSLKQISTIIV